MINDIAIILPSKILNNIISSPYICNISSRDYENINNGKISYKYLVSFFYDKKILRIIINISIFYPSKIKNRIDIRQIIYQFLLNKRHRMNNV